MTDLLDRINSIDLDAPRDISESEAEQERALELCFERVRDKLVLSVRNLEDAYLCEIRIDEKKNNSNRIIGLTIAVPTEFKKPLFGKERVIKEWVLQATCTIYLLNDAPDEADLCAVVFHFSDGTRRLKQSGEMEGEVSATRFDGNGRPSEEVVEAALDFAATWFANLLRNNTGIRKRH